MERGERAPEAPPAEAGGQLLVNGESRPLPPDGSLLALLEALGGAGPGMAVERNARVVPRAAWPETCLEPGDRLEVVRLVGGG